MLRIIDLINHKNHFLEKFYSLNETELLNFIKGNFDNLEKFYETREKILENIRYIDNQIDINKVDDTAINLENKKDWNNFTNNKEYLDGVSIFLGIHKEYIYDYHDLPDPFFSISKTGKKTSTQKTLI